MTRCPAHDFILRNGCIGAGCTACPFAAERYFLKAWPFLTAYSGWNDAGSRLGCYINRMLVFLSNMKKNFTISVNSQL